MSTGALFLAAVTLVCIVLFLNGLRFARMERNPWAGRRVFGLAVQGSNMSVDQVRRVGRIFMIASPLFWLVFAAICFGLVPAQGITPIKF